MSKLTSCKSCNAEIATSAKVCPQCGAKNKKPIYKKWWVWAVGIIVLFVVIGSQGNKDNSAPVTSPQPVSESAEVKTPDVIIEASKLMSEFESNEIKANADYKDKLAEITGTVSSIGESLGSTYIVLTDGSEYAITGIQCFFKDKNQIAHIAEIAKGDKVTVIGKIDGMSINVSVNDCKFK